MNRYFLFLLLLLFYGKTSMGRCLMQSEGEGACNIHFFEKSRPRIYYTLMQNVDGDYRLAYLLGYSNMTISGRDYISYRYFHNSWGPDRNVVDSLYFREENGRIYRYDVTQAAENLLFDFNLKEGETFRFANGEEWIVTETSDTIINKKECMVIQLESLTHQGVKDTWIESLGSITYGLYTDYDSMKSTPIGVCIMDDVAFTIDSSCFKGALARKRMSNESYRGIDIKEMLCCEFEGNDLLVRIKSYHAAESNYYVLAHIQGNDIELSYFWTDSYNEGYSSMDYEAVLSCFEPGLYHIKEVIHAYFGDAIVKELDLECKGPVGINFSTPPKGDSSGLIYDLQGRRLQKAPEKGMYIQDEIKVLVK